MDQRVSLRRFIVPALLTGLTLCGTLAWAPSASAREPLRAVVTPTRLPSATHVAHPTMSTTPVRSATRTTSGTTIPSKTVPVHFTPGATPAPNGSMLAMSKM